MVSSPEPPARWSPAWLPMIVSFPRPPYIATERELAAALITSLPYISTG